MSGHSLKLWVATFCNSDGQQLLCFQCCIRDCGFYSLNKAELFEHLRLHRPLDLEARCRCPVHHCGMLFDGDVAYFNHLSYHHYEIRLQFEGLRVLISQNKGLSPLPECLRMPYAESDKRFYDGTTLRCLWLECNKTKLYDCHVCGYRFDKGIQLTAHLQSAHGMARSNKLRRVRYKLCSDGFYRLVGSRMSSLKMTTPSVEHIQREIANIMPTEVCQAFTCDNEV
ncbi:Zinc finger protein [Trichuris trichiura]|uniref:Zinc finger protein n=1 Tax=Trichuris trichiura TaxID=36087 RepID=A0A077Z0W4_TRITR|nr:Zinc finger protein [Trichuris trichiura]